MIIISATGGSGSSFAANQFVRNQYPVCLRPDGGKQKATHTPAQIFHERMEPIVGETNINEQSTQQEMFETAYDALKKIDDPKLMLLCMTWGGLGYLNKIEEKTIFLIRDPVFAFNSYSGGGWRREGGQRRIKYVGATDQNDKKWIDAWLGDFSHWLNGANFALKAHKKGKGHIVRYNKFREDWSKIKDVPPIHLNFDSKDDFLKIQQKGYLQLETIAYIKSKTKDVWSEIQAL